MIKGPKESGDNTGRRFEKIIEQLYWQDPEPEPEEEQEEQGEQECS